MTADGKKKSSTISTQNEQQGRSRAVAAQIAKTVEPTVKQAEEARLTFLAYLLEMAVQEARRSADQTPEQDGGVED